MLELIVQLRGLCPNKPVSHQAVPIFTHLQLCFSFQCAEATDWQSAKSIYEFSAVDIDGNEVSLEKYR